MAKSKKINWDKLKIEYVTGHISQRALAAKHGVPYSTVRTRSIKEKWVEEKKRYSSKVVADAEKKLGKKEADILVKEYEIACGFVKLIEKSLENQSNYAESAVSQGKVIKTGRIDAKAVLNAANALQKFMDIKRICKGHQTVQEKQQHEVALRRLEIEEKRTSGDESKDTNYNISLESDRIERWSQ